MVLKMAPMKYMPLLAFQLVLMVLYFVFVDYGGDKDVKLRGFEDTHVMIFIGFGFLMTFLKKYCYSALGLNWLLAALVIQWALLCQQFFHMTPDNKILLTKKVLLEADIMSATVLITFGALLGVASTTQLILIAIIEPVVAAVNFFIVEHYCKAADVGGSIAIHAFGAYFGLGVSLALKGKRETNAAAPAGAGVSVPANTLNGPSYVSDVTAMIGSIFLWIYWPSFNSALTTTDAEYQRAVVNSYLSLAAAVVTSFVVSSAVCHGKFDMVHVQNSTLAGGVAVGSVCNMFVGPGGAIAIGIGAGALSVLGYKYLTPKLEKIGILDTCGVNNLHGMPGIYAALVSAIFASMATQSTYGEELGNVFAGMDDGKRTASIQALYQLLAIAVTLAISLLGGLITGFVSKLRVFSPLNEIDRYNDELNWELP